MTVKKVTLKSGKTSYRVEVNRGMIDGHRKIIVRHKDNRNEARVLEAHLKLAVAEGTYKDKEEIKEEAAVVSTFQDYYDQWWPIYVTTVESSTAYKTRGVFKNWLLPTFGNMKLTDITPSQIQKYVLEWSKDTAKAYRDRFIYLNKILTDAVDMALIAKNPCRPVKLPAQQKKGVPVYWDADQIGKFFACIDAVASPEQYTVLLFATYTGMRREELCALRVGDIDLDNNVVSVNHALASGLKGMYEKGTKTGAGTRQVPLMPDLVQQLKKWIHIIGESVGKGYDNRWLFPAPNDWSRHIDINRPNTWFKAIREANDLQPRITLHGLRHSFITNMLRAGNDVSAVQHLAGHASPDMTLRVYSGLNLSDAKMSIEKLQNYMKKA
ncbi:tyrosine-type recombinase/integrase [Lactiplantibacillus nangangensis]|uniref:Tyrosine-type recombinase/integrase n=1 Tax=Lactiplantibacillus nangangensis TaxID=2559917 RepID=A0ABW1SKT7_9LACO|nr:site-specific integrase [Lactiplantibacillus nangangensis]